MAKAQQEIKVDAAKAAENLPSIEVKIKAYNVKRTVFRFRLTYWLLSVADFVAPMGIEVISDQNDEDAN